MVDEGFRDRGSSLLCRPQRSEKDPHGSFRALCGIVGHGELPPANGDGSVRVVPAGTSVEVIALDQGRGPPLLVASA